MSKPKKKATATLAGEKVTAWVADVILDGAACISPIRAGNRWLTPADLVAVSENVRYGVVKVAFHDSPSRDPVYLKNGTIVLRRTVPRGGFTRYQAIVVHEAVHAAFDLQGSKRPFRMSAVDDESTAYLVEALFLRKRGVLASEVSDDEYLTAAYHASADARGGGGGPAMEGLRSLIVRRYGSESRVKDGVGG